VASCERGLTAVAGAFCFTVEKYRSSRSWRKNTGKPARPHLRVYGRVQREQTTYDRRPKRASSWQHNSLRRVTADDVRNESAVPHRGGRNSCFPKFSLRRARPPVIVAAVAPRPLRHSTAVVRTLFTRVPVPPRSSLWRATVVPVPPRPSYQPR